MARTVRVVDLPIRLPSGDAPLRHRISEAVLEQIRAGRLQPGDLLPSTRTLAGQLSVARGAVVAAYDELIAAGFVDGVAGSGTIVAADACLAARAGATPHVSSGPRAAAADRGPSSRHTDTATPAGPDRRWTRHRDLARPGDPARDAEPVRAGCDVLPPLAPVPGQPPSLDLAPGAPDTSLVNRADWRRAWRAGAGAPIADFARVTSAHRPLQEALARHLRRTRGMIAEPDEIVVAPGVTALLPALVAAAGWGGRQVALEDPGYLDPHTALAAAGARVRAVPVDGAGLDPNRLTRRDRGVYVTPAHQFPLGGRMPVTRRVELVDWARTTGALVVEDDYDGEFRYDVSPLPALHSLDGAAEHVVYVGTASKILVPSLRLAWVVAPAGLRAPFSRELELRGLHVPPVVSRAMAEFIDSGALARHLARAGRTYAARRAALVGALERHASWLPLEGVCAGLHVVAVLGVDADDYAVANALEARGVRVTPLSAFSIESLVQGLVIGYSTLPESAADRVARVIAGVTRHLARRSLR